MQPNIRSGLWRQHPNYTTTEESPHGDSTNMPSAEERHSVVSRSPHSSHAADGDSTTTTTATQYGMLQTDAPPNEMMPGPWPWLETMFRVRVSDHTTVASSSSTNNAPTNHDPYHRHLMSSSDAMDNHDGSNNNNNSSVEIKPAPMTAATALNMDAAAKGVLHSASAFLGPALIHCASVMAAQHSCQTSQDNNECSLTPEQAVNLPIWAGSSWLRPSSLLPLSSMASTISAALFLPVLGAIIDRTPHRKWVGAGTAYGLVVINLLQIGVTQSNWPLFLLTYTLNDLLNILHQAIVLAYLQNLTTHVPHLTHYSAQFALVQFAAMILYMLVMVVYSKATAANELSANQAAHVVSGTFGAMVLIYAWRFLFVATPPRHLEEHEQQLHPNTGMGYLCSSSWKGLWGTIRRITRDYSSLKWLLFTLLWSPSVGSGSYFSIFSTLHKSLMEMTSAQIGLVNLFTIISTIPGAKLASWLTTSQRLNPLQSFQLCLACLALNNACTAWFVKGPDQLYLYWFFQCILGLCFGWLMPTERVLFCTLTPLGQEAEMMGLVISVHTAAAWVPPFLFSALNGAGYSLRLALAAQDILLIAALLSTLGVGVFESAVAQARGTKKNDNNQPILTNSETIPGAII